MLAAPMALGYLCPGTSPLTPLPLQLKECLHDLSCIGAGNFLLLNDDEQAPLKAIDFGLAVRFDPAALPMDHLGLEGTPWWGSLLLV